MNKTAEKILMFLISHAAALGIRLMGVTMRFRERGETALTPAKKPAGKNVIYAFWHSRIYPSAFFYRDKGICVLISVNKSGEYLTRVTGRLGFTSVRGSTSRGGVEAVFALASTLKEGRDVAMIPDGPMGPRQTAQMGIIQIAKMTGLPIAPFAFDAKNKITLKDWCRTIVPLPFSKGVFAWGTPIIVPQDASDEVMEAKRLELETSLNSLEKQAASEI